jgi:hypothetical protein
MWALWVIQATTVKSLLRHIVVLSNISDANKIYKKIQVTEDVTVCCSASNSWCFEDHNATIRVFLECLICRWKHNLPWKHLEVLCQWYSVTTQGNWTFCSNAERTSNLPQEPDIHCNCLSSSSYKPLKLWQQNLQNKACAHARVHTFRTHSGPRKCYFVCVLHFQWL